MTPGQNNLQLLNGLAYERGPYCITPSHDYKADWPTSVKITQKSFMEFGRGAWNCIHNTSFSLKFTYGLSKLQYYITVSCKGLPGTNTLAYWSHS